MYAIFFTYLDDSLSVRTSLLNRAREIYMEDFNSYLLIYYKNLADLFEYEEGSKTLRKISKEDFKKTLSTIEDFHINSKIFGKEDRDTYLEFIFMYNIRNLSFNEQVILLSNFISLTNEFGQTYSIIRTILCIEEDMNTYLKSLESSHLSVITYSTAYLLNL